MIIARGVARHAPVFKQHYYYNLFMDVPVKVMDAIDYFESFGLYSGRLGKEDEYYVKVLLEFIKSNHCD